MSTNALSPAELNDLMTKLAAATEAGKIEWATSGQSGELFRTTLADTSAIIMESNSRYFFVLSDRAGVELGRDSSSSMNSPMAKLYVAAKRKALKVDQKLDGLKKFLDTL